MRNRGRIGVGTIVGLVVGAVVLMMIFAFVYNVIQRVAGKLALPTTPVNIAMHDENSLETVPSNERSMGFRLRLPLGMHTRPTSKPIVLTTSSVVAGSVANGVVLGVLARSSGDTFESVVRKFRINALSDSGEKITDEGVGTINGMKTYVISTTGPKALHRNYIIEGPDSKVYLIAAMGEASRWGSLLEVFDSSASTFEVGSFSDEPVARLPERVVPVRPPVIPFTPPVAPVIPPSGPVVPPSGPVVTPPGADDLHGIVEIQVDGNWVPAIVQGKVNGQYQVQNLRTRVSSIVGADQIRARVRRSDPPPAPVVPVMPPTPVVPQDPPVVQTPPPVRERTPPARVKPVSELNVDEAIVLLAASSEMDQRKGAEALAGMTPDKEHRAGVISKLSEVFRAKNSMTQSATVEALAVWGDDAVEKQFVDRLVTGKREERPAIFDFLSRRKTMTAAKALARRMRVPEDSAEAEAHLRKMGETAEPAVRELLVDMDKGVRARAADILKEIGTAASLPSLEKLTHDPDAAVAAGAKLAMEAIKGRTQ